MEQRIKITPFKDKCVADFAVNMKSWLEAKAAELKGEDKNKDQVYLLSFHDDGVVWGKIKDDGNLETSNFTDSPSPEFRSETLQELRLFGEKGQLHVWRKSETEYQASLALDGETGEYEFLQDEEQVLHGTKTENDSDVNREFTIVADGSEGLRHAFPQNVTFKGDKRPLRLHVKHYIEYDIDGCARIAFSRLVNVSVEGV